MSRTTRNLPGWAQRWKANNPEWVDVDKITRDGGTKNLICGSAKNGKLDEWDDVGNSGKRGKRIATHQRRQYEKKQAKKMLDD